MLATQTNRAATRLPLVVGAVQNSAALAAALPRFCRKAGIDLDQQVIKAGILKQ